MIVPRQARVLVLRTGIGIRRSYSRQEVARILRVSLAREGQIERRAVAAIGTSVRKGLCSSTGQATPASAIVVATNEASLVRQSLTSALAAGPAGSQRPAVRHPARRHASRRRQAVSGASTGVQRNGVATLARSGSSSFPWLLILLALLAVTALMTPLTRRRRLRSRAASAAAGGAAAAAGASRSRDPAPGRVGTPAGAADARGSSLAALRQADEHGDAAAAVDLGVLLEEQGDVDGAIAAYRRANARGDANGAFNLGCLLAQRDDLPGAVAAFRRADDRGDPAGASNLGVLLEQQGDLDGAVAAYRRADHRGDANGAFNLGLLLASRGDMSGARDAYRRARERGDRPVAEKANAALTELAARLER